MSVLNPRNRIVVFRLTQEEYEALRSVSATRGARNLSDFARSLLLGAIDSTEQPGGGALNEVCRAISGLQEMVGRMADRLDEISHEGAPARGMRNR
jgi:hypothetical protein